METSKTDPGASASSGAELLRRLRGYLETHTPRAEVASGAPRAAVAVILRVRAAELELLMIKRAEHDGDPWSGHVALPGGREEPSDGSLEDTAVRETREETGVDLTRHGVVYGALDDVFPRSMPSSVVVRPFVAELRSDAPIVLSDEVAAAFWVPVESLMRPGAVVESVVSVRGGERRVRSYRHGEHVVWGLTERILDQLLAALASLHFG